MTEATRVCSTCAEPKPLSKYTRQPGYADGLTRQCKDCKNAARNAKRRADPEARKAQDAAYREANRERVRENSRAYAASPKGRAAQERKVAKTAENVARVEAWRRANPERWAMNCRLVQQRRRARLLNADVGDVTADAVRGLFADYAGLCAYCLGPADAIDHVEPLKRGGLHAMANLVPACSTCNERKSAIPLIVWLARRNINPELKTRAGPEGP